MNKFEEMGVDPIIIRGLTDLGYENPMPVQELSIPILLNSDKDLLGLAQTGTGKTAAFGIPILQKINVSQKNSQALILSPTRELCMQIAGDLTDYAKYKKGLNVLAVYGGSNIDTQIRGLKKGAHVVVATPGRMLDLIRRKQTNFSHIVTVVLDEADEMLNMGFRDELNAILAETPDNKKTCLFSATMPKEISGLAHKYMKDPEEITVGTRNTGADNVSHVYYMVSNKDRYKALKRIADMNPDINGIVFCRTRKNTQEVAELLIQDGYSADSLHGDLSQAQRDYVMQKFRRKNLRMLVATDVAARGIDVSDLSHIINYELPDDPETYIHRSGRTGRAGKKGISIALVGLRKRHSIKQIENKIGKKFERAMIPTGKQVCERQLFHLIDRVTNVDINEVQIGQYLPDVFKKLEDLDRESVIKHFVSLEFNRFLEYYQDATDIVSPEDNGRDRTGRKQSHASKPGDIRLFINLGKMDKLTVPSLIGLINDATRRKNIPIGKIDLLKNFSFFEVNEAHVDLLISSFKKVHFKGRKVNIEVSDKAPSYNPRPAGRSSGRRPYPGGSKPSGGAGRSSYGGGRHSKKRSF
ncbi:MAG: DEAD/DEAH box helicase [Spirochaetaceae bacterium]|nr:DEAD/DEAH box helicase [Spirochaetaceae bacterium]